MTTKAYDILDEKLAEYAVMKSAGRNVVTIDEVIDDLLDARNAVGPPDDSD